VSVIAATDLLILSQLAEEEQHHHIGVNK